MVHDRLLVAVVASVVVVVHFEVHSNSSLPAILESAPSRQQQKARRQQPDGNWVNRFTDAKEDDPLVSTPWAAAALAICRATLTGQRVTIRAK